MAKAYDERTSLKRAQSDPSLTVTIVDHPLVRSALRLMRDQATAQE